MASFADIFSADDDRMLFDVLGDVVLYGTKPIHAMVDYAQQHVTVQDAYAIAPQMSVTVLLADVPNVKRGSKFKHNGKTLVVDAPLHESDTHITLAVNYG